MDKILEFLRELMPVWAVLLTVAFGYLVFLFKKASDKFISLADKQAEYLKERFEVVDKSTTIFSRTIEQQEKEIDKLTKQIGRLSEEVEDTRQVSTERAVTELKLLSETIQKVVQGQEYLFGLVEQRQLTSEAAIAISGVRAEISENLEEGIPRAIKFRDRSIYPIEVVNILGAEELIKELQEHGFVAKIYEEEYDEDVAKEWETHKQKAIWLGARIPPALAIEAISIAINHWPFLQYVHLSTDSLGPDDTHSELFIGGSTNSAVKYFHLKPWTTQDFQELRADMTFTEFHSYIRKFYRAESNTNT